MRTTTNFAYLAFTWAALCGVSPGQQSAATQDAAREQARDQTKVEVAQVLRTADIVGTAVRNKQNENLGKIDDLVIDMKTGEVRYAALAYGGVAGVGAKMFAVPLNKLTYKLGEPNNREARHFVFEVSKNQLDNSEGFDTSHWPKVADSKLGAGDTQRDASATQPGRDGATIAFETVFRASKIKGMDVRNDANENLGSVDELVIDLTKAHVKYVALSFGSVFTGGNKLFAVPLAHCTLTHANDKTFIKLNVSQDSLKNAPGFDKNQWPDTANPNWHREIDTFYQRSAARPANRP